MSPFGASCHLVSYKNAHLIKELYVTELVELLMTATVHTSHTCTVPVISNSTRLSQLPGRQQNSEFIKKISVHIDLLHAVVPRAVLAAASLGVVG